MKSIEPQGECQSSNASVRVELKQAEIPFHLEFPSHHPQRVFLLCPAIPSPLPHWMCLCLAVHPRRSWLSTAMGFSYQCLLDIHKEDFFKQTSSQFSSLPHVLEPSLHTNVDANKRQVSDLCYLYISHHSLALRQQHQSTSEGC